MWLAPTYMVMTVECVWCLRCVAMIIGCDWYPCIWRWQLDVIGVHEFGGASWMWFVTACVVAAVRCAWLPKCAGMANGCGWCSRI